MRISDFVKDFYCSYELRNKTIEDNKYVCNSLNDTQNDSGVSIVINVDLSNNDKQTNEDDENTRKLYRKFYRANSY